MDENVIRLRGSVGADPEVASIKDTKRAMLSIATNIQYQNKAGEISKVTSWHSLAGWGTVAEYVEANIKKGDRVVVRGTLNYYYTHEQNGGKVKRTSIRIISIDKLAKPLPKEGTGIPTPAADIPPATDKDYSDTDDLPF